MIKTDYKRRILALLLTVALMLKLIPAMESRYPPQAKLLRI